MSTLFAESNSLLDGNYSKPFGLGFEFELIQRSAKTQITHYLPEITETLQDVWDHRDQEIEEFLGESKLKTIIPIVDKNNIRSGIEGISILESPISMWPSILIYARDGNPYAVQSDQFDTENVIFIIEILCADGPIKKENVHSQEGLESMELLDRKLQRLSDAVYLCIKKDPTISGAVGQIEKPPTVKTSLPMTRKAELNATGETYIFQGKQLSFQAQKITY